MPSDADIDEEHPALRRLRQDSAHAEDLTPEAVRLIEARWKSDIEQILEVLLRRSAEQIAFQKKYEQHLEAQIEAANRWKKAQDAIIHKTLGALAWGAVLGLLSLIWHGLQYDMRNVVDAVKEATRR